MDWWLLGSGVKVLLVASRCATDGPDVLSSGRGVFVSIYSRLLAKRPNRVWV